MFEDIKKEREKKLLSMFTDQFATEYQLMMDQISSKIKVLDNFMVTLDNITQNDFSRNFGTGPFDKYYGTHALRVTRFVSTYLDPNIKNFKPYLIVSLIHNALEKKIYSFQDLEIKYGSWVANSIQTLTQNRDEMKSIEGKKKYYKNLDLAEAELLLVKACDKLDNVFAQCLHKDKKQREDYFLEIEEFILPRLSLKYPLLKSTLSKVVCNSRALGFFRPNFYS